MCFRELKGRLINYHKIWIRGDIKHKHQTLNTWGYVTRTRIEGNTDYLVVHRLTSPNFLGMNKNCPPALGTGYRRASKTCHPRFDS